jgi:hypothetical protein
MIVRKCLNFALFTLCLAQVTPAAAKDADFAKDHPRRAEVNERIRNEERRITEGVRSGKLTKAEAHKLRGELRGIKAQERAEVRANGGYLTKSEKNQLNQELNQDSRQIYKEKHPGTAPTPITTSPSTPPVAASGTGSN